MKHGMSKRNLLYSPFLTILNHSLPPQRVYEVIITIIIYIITCIYSVYIEGRYLLRSKLTVDEEVRFQNPNKDCWRTS